MVKLKQPCPRKFTLLVPSNVEGSVIEVKGSEGQDFNRMVDIRATEGEFRSFVVSSINSRLAGGGYPFDIATSKYHEKTRTLLVVDATDLELLPSEAETIPTTEPTPEPPQDTGETESPTDNSGETTP